MVNRVLLIFNTLFAQSASSERIMGIVFVSPLISETTGRIWIKFRIVYITTVHPKLLGG